MALFFRSAVDLWHDVGSVGVPALLVALGTSYSRRFRMRPRAAAWYIAVSGVVALAWLLTKFRAGAGGGYLLGIEPIYVGLGVSLMVWLIDRLKAAGVEAELLTLTGAGHGFKGKDAETAEKALLAFFDRHLKK